MIIVNLSHMETVARDNEVHGGSYSAKLCYEYKPEKVEKPYKPSVAIAIANADAKANGLNFAFTETDTFTKASSDAHGASAVSSSYSKAVAA